MCSDFCDSIPDLDHKDVVLSLSLSNSSQASLTQKCMHTRVKVDSVILIFVH